MIKAATPPQTDSAGVNQVSGNGRKLAWMLAETRVVLPSFFANYPEMLRSDCGNWGSSVVHIPRREGEKVLAGGFFLCTAQEIKARRREDPSETDSGLLSPAPNWLRFAPSDPVK